MDPSTPEHQTHKDNSSRHEGCPLISLRGRRAEESCCNFDREEENYWITVQSNGVPKSYREGGINKAAKAKHIDQKMLSRKVNVKHSVASLVGLNATSNDDQRCVKKCQTKASREVTGK